MPNNTSFALMYRKLVDHNFEADPERLARTRDNLIAQLSAHSPPELEKWTWTRTANYDTIHSKEKTGEDL